MSDATLSVLARMAGGSRPATASSSDLGVFAAAVAKAVKTASAALLSSEIETSVAACSSAPLGEKLQTKPDSGVYYWVNDESGAPAALFAIEPAFAASMTERLLGGELTAPAAEAESSILIFDMASALIDVAAPALSAIFAKLTDARSAPSLRGKRGARMKAQALLDVETLPVCAVALGSGAVRAIAQPGLTALVGKKYPAGMLPGQRQHRRAVDINPEPVTDIHANRLAESRETAHRAGNAVVTSAFPA